MQNFYKQTNFWSSCAIL